MFFCFSRWISFLTQQFFKSILTLSNEKFDVPYFYENHYYHSSNAFLNTCYILTIDSQWFNTRNDLICESTRPRCLWCNPWTSASRQDFKNKINFCNKNRERQWIIYFCLFQWIWFMTVCIFHWIIKNCTTTSGNIYIWVVDFLIFFALFEQLVDKIVPALSTQNVKFGFLFDDRWTMNNGKNSYTIVRDQKICLVSSLNAIDIIFQFYLIFLWLWFYDVYIAL